MNVGSGPEEDPEDTLEDEDDIVRSDLDMHSLILTSNPQDSSVSTYLNGLLPYFNKKNHKKSQTTYMKSDSFCQCVTDIVFKQALTCLSLLHGCIFIASAE